MDSVLHKTKTQYTPSVSGEKKRVRFIINPHSGVRKRINLENLIAQELDKTQFDYHITYTEYAGHATELAAEAVTEGYDMVVAVGGDGSVNEVAKSLIGTDTVLGILPAGSGNGFAMYLGWGRDITTVLRRFNTAKIETIDTGLMNDRPFVNLAGVGFEASVVFNTRNAQKRGMQGYIKGFFNQLFSYKFKTYKIKVDNQSYETDALTITVANAPMYGYNFIVAPLAKYNDGKLEVVVFKKARKLRYLVTTFRMLNRTVNKSPLVKRFSGEKIEISLKEPDFAQVDGEGYPIENEKLVFTVKPLSLKVLVPSRNQ
jgi:diacylglycerol kinase (ATP)